MSRMGTNTTSQHQDMAVNMEGASPEERAMADRLTRLGMSQADAVQFAIEQSRGDTGRVGSLQLTPEDQATLDRAFAGAETNLRRFGNIMGQDLAGTRGLNTSDTPVSEAVLRETLPAFASLQSDKAQQGLGLGLNLAQLGQQNRQFNLQSLLGAANAMPTGLGFNLNRMQNERFNRANRQVSGFGATNDSILSQMNQGAQFRLAMHQGTNQAAQAGGGVMKMMGGM